jgi:hypothetical protein
MKDFFWPQRSVACLSAAVFAIVALAAFSAMAQNPELQEKLAMVKQSAAQNKQALSQYTWQEQQTTSLKGDVKKQQMFQVHMGPDGKPQKTELMQEPSSSDGGRKHGLKHHVEEKKKGEFEDYAHSIAALAQSYAAPDPGKLQQAYEQGNVMLGPAGAPGEIKMVIKNYVKPNDSVEMVFNQTQKAIQSLQISSYLDDPSDAVKILVTYAKLPDGTNHVSTTNIDGVKKQLTVVTQNSNYQKM